MNRCAYCKQDVGYDDPGGEFHRTCLDEFNRRFDSNTCVRCGQQPAPKGSFCGDCSKLSAPPWRNYPGVS